MITVVMVAIVAVVVVIMLHCCVRNVRARNVVMNFSEEMVANVACLEDEEGRQ